MRAARRALLAGLAAAAAAPLAAVPAAPVQAPPTCSPGGPPVTFGGTLTSADATPSAPRYLLNPFTVAAGTTRVEVSYDWADNEPAIPDNPLTQTVLDLGLWDQDGYRQPEGFRGWSGSRVGRVAAGQPPAFVQPDRAERGYLPGPIEAGTWYVEIGVAAVTPAPPGARWTASVPCSDPDVGEPVVPQPVDPAHVADPQPGWYHGDFHMHGYHSNLQAPDWDGFVALAREENLDFLPVTDYVTTQHWAELGPVQAANPDLVVWPSREIITYYGHATSLGETPDMVEYRHGFEDVTLRAVQEGVKADGALFQVNHPTIFPGPLFSNFCRGCAFQEGELLIDWDQVDSIEVLTGPVLVSTEDLGLPGLPVMIQSPFLQPAIDLWERQLLAGHRITAVSGSDSKGVESGARREQAGLGSSATAVHAENLSRPALAEAVRAGHAYVRTMGVDESPALEMVAETADGQRGIFGDSLAADEATVTVTVTGGRGQLLQVIRNGQPASLPVLIDADPFVHTFAARRAAEDGPLGTFWRVETAAVLPGPVLTTIGNPIFLTGPRPPSPVVPLASASGHDRPRTLPATGGPGPAGLAAAGLAVAVLARLSRRGAGAGP